MHPPLPMKTNNKTITSCRFVNYCDDTICCLSIFTLETHMMHSTRFMHSYSAFFLHKVLLVLQFFLLMVSESRQEMELEQKATNITTWGWSQAIFSQQIILGCIQAILRRTNPPLFLFYIGLRSLKFSLVMQKLQAQQNDLIQFFCIQPRE